MAAIEDSVISLPEHQEKCWVCYEYFRDSFPVLHVYCEKCIGMGGKHMPSRNRLFVCPICRTCMEIPQIKDNERVANKSREVNTTSRKCGESLCLSCSEACAGELWSSDDYQLSLEEMISLSWSDKSFKTESDDENSLFVTNSGHGGGIEDLKVCCEKCGAILCMVNNNNQLVGSSMRPEDKVTCLVSKLDHKMDELDKVVANGKDVLNHVESDVKHVRNKIVKWFEEKKNSLLSKLDAEREHAIAQIESELEDASLKRTTFNNTLRCVQSTLDIPDESRRMIECQSLIPMLLELNHQVAIIHTHTPVFAFTRGGSPNVKVGINVKLESSLETRILGVKEPHVLCEAVRTKTFNTVQSNCQAKGSCWGITVNQAMYLTTDWKAELVKVFSLDGVFQQTLKDGNYALKCPVDVATDPNTDETVVSDDDIKGVVIYDKNLKQKKVLKNVYKGWGSLAFGRGQIVVAGTGRITILDKQGSVVNVINHTVLGLDEFNPLHVAVDKDGNILTTDRIQRCVFKLNYKGDEIIYKYPPNDNTSFENPRGVCVDEWGHVIVVDGESSALIHVISASGSHHFTLPTCGGSLTNPRGIVYCGNGEVSVLQILGTVNVYKYMDL